MTTIEPSTFPTPAIGSRVYVNSDEYNGEGIVTGTTDIRGNLMVNVRIPNMSEPQAFYDYEINEN
jgi:hypothetical protein